MTFPIWFSVINGVMGSLVGFIAFSSPGTYFIELFFIIIGGQA
jgi:hypothetical protein